MLIIISNITNFDKAYYIYKTTNLMKAKAKLLPFLYTQCMHVEIF
jgi:hypothetical protein